MFKKISPADRDEIAINSFGACDEPEMADKPFPREEADRSMQDADIALIAAAIRAFRRERKCLRETAESAWTGRSGAAWRMSFRGTR